MGILRKYVGTDKHSIYVLSTFASILSRNFSNENSESDSEVRDNLWDLWDWMMWFYLENGKINKDDFIRLYTALNRELGEPKYLYQKDDQQLAQIGQKMYEEFRLILRPHLSTAFLPESYTSEVWPLIGRPLKHVKLSEGFGDNISSSIFSVFVSYGVADIENGEIALLSHIMGQTFIRILKESDTLDRRERLGQRSASFDVVPFFGLFMLMRHAKIS